MNYIDKSMESEAIQSTSYIFHRICEKGGSIEKPKTFVHNTDVVVQASLDILHKHHLFSCT